MTETTTREPLVLSPLEDEPAVENLPEPIPLTPEQIAAQAEADERDHQRQREWALVVEALNDNSLAVVRAMRRFTRSGQSFIAPDWESPFSTTGPRFSRWFRERRQPK